MWANRHFDGSTSRRRPHSVGWYATFALLFVAAFAGIYWFTGRDAVGATVRLVYGALFAALDGLLGAASTLLELLARGLGWGRLRSFSRFVAGIGLGYAAGVVLSDQGVRRARGWRHKVAAAFAVMSEHWERLPFLAKLLVVIVLIASQVYLNWLLVVFPIAFLVPVVRRLWAQTADLLFSAWYWKTFGKRHRAVVAALRRRPIARRVIGAFRLLRIRYLCAWRLWRYDPRYQIADTHARHVSLVEPIRLWRSGKLDAYIRSPLLAGPRSHRGLDGAGVGDAPAVAPVGSSSTSTPG